METDYFDIVAGVLKGDRLTPYLFIICLDYVLQMSIDLMKENCFTLVKDTLLWIWTTPLTERFWQIPPPKPNPCYIIWNKQQVA